MNRGVAWGVMVLVLGAAWSVNAHNYVGVARCKTCHDFAYTIWKRGPHAKAHLDLSAEQRKDPKCNTCHSMTAVSEVDENVQGGQCESCHGPGRYYYADYVMRDAHLARAVGLVEQQAQVCTRCHTAGSPSLEEFSYEAFWAKIDHGEQARKVWEKREAESAAKTTASEKTAQR